MPLAKTILELLPDKDQKKASTPGGAYPQAYGSSRRRSSVRFSSIGPGRADRFGGVRAFFGFTNWPNGIAHLDLGGRTVDVIPTPGHNPTHLAFYDNRTGILFSGDFLMPGRLLIETPQLTAKARCGLSTF